MDIPTPVKKDPQLHVSNKKTLTFGQRASDTLTAFLGSWFFIISFLLFLMAWMFVNVMAFIGTWDPYPFILLNLALSCLASLQAPIIMMSQNRQAERDRVFAKYDYAVNRKAEREIQNMQKDLDEIKALLKQNSGL